MKYDVDEAYEMLLMFRDVCYVINLLELSAGCQPSLTGQPLMFLHSTTKVRLPWLTRGTSPMSHGPSGLHEYPLQFPATVIYPVSPAIQSVN